MITERKRTGPKSLFRGKVRAPVSSLLTPDQLALLAAIKTKTGYSNGSVFGLLLEQHGKKLLAA